MRCAVIGLGNMGGPIAENLLKAGHEVRGFDVVEQSVQTLVEAGGAAGATVAECVRDAEFVVTMLPSSPHVEEVVCGAGGVLESAPPGACLIEMSTIAPEATRRVAAAAGQRGFSMIDAPVSRGQAAAIAGELLIMVGGSKADFERSRPVLDVLGSDVLYLGPSGAGAVAKLVNNMAVGSILAATAEALVFGVEAGVSVDSLVSVLTRASGGSWLLDNMFPRALRGDYSPGFFIDHMHKDLGLALAEANAQSTPIAVTATAREIFSAARARGMGKLDCTAVMRYLAELSDTPVLSAAATSH